jgi:hypothetical protein
VVKKRKENHMAREDDLFRLVAVIRRNKFRTILDLLEGETEDIQFAQMTPERMEKWGYGSSIHERRRKSPVRRGTPGNPHQWELRLWPLFKPIFEAAKGKDLHLRDERFKSILQDHGHKSTNVSPTFTSFTRAGLLVRTGKGWYNLPCNSQEAVHTQH